MGELVYIDILNKTDRACLQIFYLCFNALLEVGSQPFSSHVLIGAQLAMLMATFSLNIPS